MLGFYIKKAFFDGWDNLIQLLLQNLVYVVAVFLFLGALSFLGESLVGFYLTIIAFVLVFSCLLGGTAAVVRNFANYQSETWKPFFKGIKRNIGHSLLFAGIVFSLLIIVGIGVPFYFSFDSFVINFLGVILLWVCIFTVLSLPYYFPLMSLLPGDGPMKTLKKCFIVSFDNFGYSLFLLVHQLIDLVVTVFTLGLCTGVCGIMLGNQVMGKLIMKKYDWQEENPDKAKNEMDWDEVLYEEKETVGPRTLKNMIFPWK